MHAFEKECFRKKTILEPKKVWGGLPHLRNAVSARVWGNAIERNF